MTKIKPQINLPFLVICHFVRCTVSYINLKLIFSYVCFIHLIYSSRSSTGTATYMSLSVTISPLVMSTKYQDSAPLIFSNLNGSILASQLNTNGRFVNPSLLHCMKLLSWSLTLWRRNWWKRRQKTEIAFQLHLKD